MLTSLLIIFTDHAPDAAENMMTIDISGIAKAESQKLGSGCHLTSKLKLLDLTVLTYVLSMPVCAVQVRMVQPVMTKPFYSQLKQLP